MNLEWGIQRGRLERRVYFIFFWFLFLFLSFFSFSCCSCSCSYFSFPSIILGEQGFPLFYFCIFFCFSFLFCPPLQITDWDSHFSYFLGKSNFTKLVLLLTNFTIYLCSLYILYDILTLCFFNPRFMDSLYQGPPSRPPSHTIKLKKKVWINCHAQKRVKKAINLKNWSDSRQHSASFLANRWAWPMLNPFRHESCPSGWGGGLNVIIQALNKAKNW